MVTQGCFLGHTKPNTQPLPPAAMQEAGMGRAPSTPPPKSTDPSWIPKLCPPPLPQVPGSVPSVSLISDGQGGSQSDVLSPLSIFLRYRHSFLHSSLMKQEADKPQCSQTSVPLLALSNLRGAPSPLGPPGLVRNSTPPPTLPLPDWSVFPRSFKPIFISSGW